MTQEEQQLILKYFKEIEIEDFRDKIQEISLTEKDKDRALAIISNEISEMINKYYDRRLIIDFEDDIRNMACVRDINPSSSKVVFMSQEQIEKSILEDDGLKYYSNLVSKKFKR